MTRGSIFEPAQAKLSAVLTQLNMSMLKGWEVSTKSTVRRGWLVGQYSNRRSEAVSSADTTEYVDAQGLEGVD
jgi:hypothetical protein